MTSDETRPTPPLAPMPGEPTEDDILDRFLDYVDGLGHELYPAQERAILELFGDNNVILRTPTGSGKSLVAAAMHFRSICLERRSVYTCPIKALVNEKFLALCRDFGAENVGMSTGDASVNLDAPILCCTAEVLSNMALRDGANTPVDDVILDEFHYYSDRERGVAWQVPLLTLPHARFLLLSATLGDTTLFEERITRLTGAPTVTVSSEDRPVPLQFIYSEDGLDEVVLRLREQKRLPVYIVHFTQRAATETAQNLFSLNFCTREEKEQLGEILARQQFTTPFGKVIRKYLRHGIGVHHAGMLPRYRVLVEKLAQQNLLKVICGTDTLGVGVNVPIRTVLFTGMSKFDGEKQRILPSRDFHQISGRAGRRGFDNEGFVVVQAPEHVIENRKMERKARENPAKAKKFVRRKPPEKGFVNWDENTFQRVLASPPEPLSSSFTVTHGMLLNVLGRATDGCAAMRQLIRDCHETETAKKALRRRAFALFRSLVDKQIIEILPRPEPTGRKVRINVDLQQDFSLHETLSLYLVDTVTRLDTTNPAYPLLVLSLTESVLENPTAILRRQVDHLKDTLMREMKEQGVPYEERIERLQHVEHPKPERDFIYNTFNEFAAKHPWVGQDNIQPKSIAREMFERYLSFSDYTRDYGLERAEGLLLRHLSNVYKTLTQTVPEGFWTDEVRDIILYLEQIVRSTDSSILEEWERMRDLNFQPDATLGIGAAGKPAAAPFRPLDPERDRDAFTRLVRHGIFSVLRPLATGQYASAAETLAVLAGRPPEDAAPPPLVSVPDHELNEGRGPFRWHADALKQALYPFFNDHHGIRLDPPARAADKTHIFRDPLDDSWKATQILVDPDEHNDWLLSFTIDHERMRESHEPALQLDAIGPAEA